MNTINTTFIWLAIFILAVVIATLYNEIKELKSRANVRDAPEKRAVGKNLLGIIEEMEKEIESKDVEIKNLKAELNKVKFDHACEVAGKK